MGNEEKTNSVLTLPSSPDSAQGPPRRRAEVLVGSQDFPGGIYHFHEASRSFEGAETSIDLLDNIQAMVPRKMTRRNELTAFLCLALKLRRPWKQLRQEVPAVWRGELHTHPFTCELKDGRSFTGCFLDPAGSNQWFAFQAVCFPTECDWIATALAAAPLPASTQQTEEMQTEASVQVAPKAEPERQVVEPRTAKESEEDKAPVAEATSEESIETEVQPESGKEPESTPDVLLDDAKSAYAQHRYGEAHDLFLMLRQTNEAEACYYLGNMRRYGQGCKADLAQAEELLRKGSALGHANCAAELGFLLLERDNIDAAEKAFDRYFDTAYPNEDQAVRTANTGRYLLQRSIRCLPVSHRKRLLETANQQIAKAVEESIAAEQIGGLLHLAAARRDLARLGRFLGIGADANVKNARGATPMHCLCGGEPGYSIVPGERDSAGFRAARQLLDRGADVNAQDNEGATPLHYAAATANRVLVDFLLMHGASAEAKSTTGITPLHMACCAFLDRDLGGPSAAAVSRREIAQSLLDKGVDGSVADESSQTPLHCAARRLDAPLVSLLLERGADASAATSGNIRPLQEAIVSSWRQNKWDEDVLQLLSALLAAGASPNAKFSGGRTPLYFAIMTGNADLAELLLGAEADPDLKIHNGLTPLDRARHDEEKGLIALLKANQVHEDQTCHAYLERVENAVLEGGSLTDRIFEDNESFINHFGCPAREKASTTVTDKTGLAESE